MARDCDRQAVAVAVFPELGISGYAISDLLQQTTLLDAVETAIETIVAGSADLMPLLLVGAPLRHLGALYNCAVAIHRGALLGVVPKIHLPNYREFYEPRHFVSGDGTDGGSITIGGHTAPFGTDLLFAAADLRGLIVHAEICEDVWVPNPPSGEAAVAGATVLANLSASNITIGKAETRRLLCRSQSARCLAAYLYAAAGAGESTTDLAWDGQASVFENGNTLAETERFPVADQAAIADIDLDLLAQERLQMGSFDTNRRRHARPFRRIGFTVSTARRRCRLPAPDRAVSVRAGRCRAAGAGLLRGLQHPGLRPGAAAARDRIEEGGDRHFGRAWTPPRRCWSAPRRSICSVCRGRHSGLYDAGVRDLGSHQVQRAGR